MSFNHKTSYHRGDQEGDPPDNLRQSIVKDGIPAEIYKGAGPNALGAFHDVLLTVWEGEIMPDDFRYALIISLYKKKGSKSDCGNYRGIFLLPVSR